MNAKRPTDSPPSRRMSRAEFLRMSGTVGLAVAFGCTTEGSSEASAASEDTASETDEERLARIIREYDAQGIHRTGTRVDRESADWLLAELRGAGARAQLEGMPFSRIDVVECFVELPTGERIEGIPLFDSPPTGPEGVTGRLGDLDSDAAIGMDEVAPSPAYSPGFFAQRETARQSAQLAITGGERWGLPPGYALINAERYTDPFGPPVLQLPTQARGPLEQSRGETVRCVSQVKRQEVEVFNVTATVAGTDPSLPPLVVMTPRSGWWNCASERGGGIALLVELARTLADARPAASTHFVASTGHELGHYGLEHFLAAHREWIGGARAWIHLGANFAAAVGGSIRLQASDEALETLALEAMAGGGVEPASRTPIGTRPYGEARNVFDGGGRYLSLLGMNGLFHHPADRWPDAVDMQVAEHLARALCSVALELTRA